MRAIRRNEIDTQGIILSDNPTFLNEVCLPLLVVFSDAAKMDLRKYHRTLQLNALWSVLPATHPSISLSAGSIWCSWIPSPEGICGSASLLQPL